MFVVIVGVCCSASVLNMGKLLQSVSLSLSLIGLLHHLAAETAYRIEAKG